MPDAVMTFSKWLQRWQAIVAVCIGLIAIGGGWQAVKSDTAAMRERIEGVEKRIESLNSDHDLLIRIDANVQAINERVKRIESQTK